MTTTIQRQAEELEQQVALCNSLAGLVENPAYYQSKIEDKLATIERINAEICDLKRERDALPESLMKAERRLKEMKKQHNVASNPALKKLLRLKAQVAALEKEVGDA